MKIVPSGDSTMSTGRPNTLLPTFKEPGKEWFFGDLTFPPMERNYMITNLLRSVPGTTLGNECGITEFRHLGMIC
jgi:hypothetical protein